MSNKKKNKPTLCCLSVKNTSFEACADESEVKRMDLRERIERAKKNKYSKDTWQHQVVTFTDTGESFTMGEIDKILNN